MHAESESDEQTEQNNLGRNFWNGNQFGESIFFDRRGNVSVAVLQDFGGRWNGVRRERKIRRAFGGG